ncbi:MAG TPA: ABC transporter permease, partial [Gemmatimonadaceae bacterium]|nr:ABC transporter permease [Gemmatimonadaceae bacterium]
MGIIRAIWFRMRALFDRRALDSELDLEMRDHIERETRANITRGMSPAEARRVALAAFGGLQQFKEETRDARGAHWFDALRQDAAHAARSLLKSPGFTATVVITLALGVGANAAVYSVLQRIYLREPAGIAKGSELRRVYERLPAKANMNGSGHEMFVEWFDYPEFSALHDELRGHAELAIYKPTDSVAVKEGDNVWPARETFVSSDFFSTLGITPARGRFFAPNESAVENDPGIAVISYALWDRAFAKDPSVIGRTVQIGKRQFAIVGVSPGGFTGLDLSRAEIFLPLGAIVERKDFRGNPWYASKTESYFRMVARVPAGDDRQLIAIGTPINRRFNADNRGQALEGTKPDTLSSIVTGSIIAALGPVDSPKEYAVGLRVAGVAAIVLLIACANIANLLLVRASQRRHEVAIRLALGVSRARLTAQFLTEGLILAGAGGVAAIVFAAWGGTALRHLILPTTRFATSAIDLPVLGFTLAVAVITGLAAAMVPTVQGTSVDIVKSLKPGTRGAGRARSRTRSTLLAAQTALSLVLLAGAGLFVRSLQRIHSAPVGYAADELAFATLRFDDDATPNAHRAERIAAFPRAAQRVATAPGVVGVALAYITPLQGGIWTSVWKPDIDSEMPAPQYNAVSPEFFSVTGVR